MRNGEISPSIIGHKISQLNSVIADSSVAHLNMAEVTELIEITSEAINRLTALRSRSALQASRIRAANTGQNDPRSKERSVKNLFDNSGMGQREIKHEAAKTKILEALPKLEKNVGEISKSNFDLLAKQIGRLKDEQVAQLDQNVIVTKAKSLPADNFATALAFHINESTTTPLQNAKAMRAASKVKHWLDRTTGMGHIHAELDPERYERIANRIDRETTRLANQSKLAKGISRNATKDANLAADAFCNILDTKHRPNARLSSKTKGSSIAQFSSGTDNRPNRIDRPNPIADLLVLVDVETLKKGRHKNTVAETEAGSPLADETISRLACDSTIRKIEIDSHGLALNVSRKSRTATDAQWAATKSMHSTCAWHGCTTRIQHTQLHHIKYWRHGGQTDMNNLVPLCSHHHHKVHEGGWRLKLEPDRSLIHIKPDKTIWKKAKPPKRINSS